MLDLKLWTKLYWENNQNHWTNLANELKDKNPYEYAMEISKRIQKINDDYFKECSEGSSGYYPTIETDKKYKKLKKELGEKSKQISIKDWVEQLNTVSEKAVLFFYYFSKQTCLKEKIQIIAMIPNYNQKIIDYLKKEIVNLDKKQNSNKKYLKEVLESLNNELQRIAEEEKYKSNQLVLNFFNIEKKEKWFKNNLSSIVMFKIFIYFNAHILEETKEDLIQWSQFLKSNASKESLIHFNSILMSYLNLFEKEDRLTLFVKLLPIECSEAFEKLLLSDLNNSEQLEKWYSLAVRQESDDKSFFDKIWSINKKGIILTTNLNSDSIILDFFANKMSVIYSKEEIKNFDFTKSLIVNDNIQEIMSKKISYYYLENKLNKIINVKSKNIKI